MDPTPGSACSRSYLNKNAIHERERDRERERERDIYIYIYIERDRDRERERDREIERERKSLEERETGDCAVLPGGCTRRLRFPAIAPCFPAIAS